MKDWIVKSFGDHPAYTIIFGVACFIAGVMFAGFVA